MIKWLFKWLFRFFLLAVVITVAVLLSFNSLLRVMIEHNIRAQTGMDAEIGRVEFGWSEPTIEIRDLKIYNPPSFGGTPFLNLPEIHIEYDRAALLKRELHLTLLRLNLAELDIVRSKKGTLNVLSLGKATRGKSGAAQPSFKSETGYQFEGIDELNVSFNKAKFIDLENSHNNHEQMIGLANCVVPDVRSANDLAGLVLIIDLRSNHFFDPLISGEFRSAPLKSVLRLIGAAF